MNNREFGDNNWGLRTQLTYICEIENPALILMNGPIADKRHYSRNLSRSRVHQPTRRVQRNAAGIGVVLLCSAYDQIYNRDWHILVLFRAQAQRADFRAN